MKKILLIALTLVLCTTCAIAPASTALADDYGISTYSAFALNVAVNTGVASVTVKYGSTTKTFTSSGSVTINQGTSYTWTAVAEPGYTLSASSGSGTMNYAHGIGPTATKNSYTLTVTINTGIQSVTVVAGSTTKTFTSSGTMSIDAATYVRYTATAKAEYTIDSGSEGTFTMSGSKTIAPTATHIPYTLTVTLNEGVQSITVTYGSTTKTFTSSGSISVPFATSFTWTATAKSGYELSQSSGGSTMYYPITISPTASRITYTVSVSKWEPSVIPSISVSWSLTWASGATITANVSNYVTMTVASDGMSVTLTKIKDFDGSNMVLTCYLTADPTVKATCTVTCGS